MQGKDKYFDKDGNEISYEDAIATPEEQEKSWETLMREYQAWDDDADAIDNFANAAKLDIDDARVKYNLNNELPDSVPLEYLNKVKPNRYHWVQKYNKKDEPIPVPNRLVLMNWLDGLCQKYKLYYDIDRKKILYTDDEGKKSVVDSESDTLSKIHATFYQDTGRIIDDGLLNSCLITVALAYRISERKQFFDFCWEQWKRKPENERAKLHQIISYWGDMDNPELTDAYLRRAIVATVARGYLPDTTVYWPYMVIFSGRTGIGKSHNLAKLFGRFKIDKDPFGKERDVLQAVERFICVHHADLSNFHLRNVDNVKGFVDKEFDEYRKPYDRYYTEYPRRFCLFGSTNRDKMLRDCTGDRRFHVVKLLGNEVRDSNRLARDRLDIIGEAVDVIKTTNLGTYLEIPAHYLKMNETENLSNVIETKMDDYLSRLLEGCGRNLFQKRDIGAYLDLSGCPGREQTADSIALAFKNMGYIYGRKRLGKGKRIWCWHPIEMYGSETVVEFPSMTEVIPQKPSNNGGWHGG